MPTYQYACTACSHRLEAVQAFTDASLTECPECSGRLRKLYGAVGVVFKGDGFYRTDSRAKEKSSSSGAATSGTESAAKSPAKESTEAAKSEPSKVSSTSSTSTTTAPAAAAS